MKSDTTQDRRQWHWVSTKKMTFGYAVLDGMIAEVAPIARWSLHHPEVKLINWLKKQPGFRHKRLS